MLKIVSTEVCKYMFVCMCGFIFVLCVCVYEIIKKNAVICNNLLVKQFLLLKFKQIC